MADEERALDASALLAFIFEETGSEHVDDYIRHSLISSVNWSEVAQKCRQRGVDWQAVSSYLTNVGLEVIVFGRRDADLTAELWPMTRELGLSLADRACLAVAIRRGCPVITADRIWERLTLDVDIEVLR